MFSAIWPTCGWMHDGSAYQLPLSALLIPGSVSSFSLGELFRTPLAADAVRGGETLAQVRARGGTVTLLHQVIDLALHGADGSPNRKGESEMLWDLVEDIFNAGDAMPMPLPDGNTSLDAQHRHPRS